MDAPMNGGWDSHSEQIDAVAKAFVAFAGKVRDVKRERIADAGQYSYKYADLGDALRQVRPLLAAEGLAVTQSVTIDAHDVKVWTIVLHQSGQWFTTHPVVLPAGTSAQQAGSGISYSRRYGLMAALGLATEDDNGASAGTRQVDIIRAENEGAAHRAEDAAAQERGWMTLREQLDEFAALVADTNVLDVEDVREWCRSEHITNLNLTRNQAGVWAVKLAEHKSGDAAAAAPADEAGEGIAPDDPSPAAADVPADENGDPL